MSDLDAGDFLGAFAMLRRGERWLLVANQRVIGGVLERTWDLPGGRVEAGESVREALARELREEVGMELIAARFAFVQEGLRILGGVRRHAWRSFFFIVDAVGEPVADHEVLAARWLTSAEIEVDCTAPYHDSFRTWLRTGGSWFESEWRN